MVYGEDSSSEKPETAMFRAANRLVPRNEEGVRSMKNIAVLTTVALAALILAHAVPAYAAQSTVAVSNSGTAVDTVVRTQSTVPAHLVRMGHGGGGHAFRSGGFRTFRGAGFRNFYVRHHRFFRPFFFGPVYAPYYTYGSYYDDSVWDEYPWVCYDDLYSPFAAGLEQKWDRDKVQDRIETLALWKLIEYLDLDQATADKLLEIHHKFLSQRKSLQKGLSEDFQALRKELSDSSKPEDEKELARLLLDTREKRKELQGLREQQYDAVSKVLTLRQMAQLVLFSKDFHRELRSLLRPSQAPGGMPEKGMGPPSSGQGPPDKGTTGLPP